MNHLIHRLKKIGLKPCTLFKGKQKGPDSLPSHIPDVETLGGLSDVAATLDTICRDAEPRFLEIGEKLQAFYFEATGLAQQTLDAVKLVGGDGDESVLVKVKGVSRNALHELEGRQARVVADLENAKAVVKQLEGLFSICSVLDKISLSLGVVGLNIGIEGASSEQAHEKFTDFSSDIRKLSERIAGIGQAILENAKSAMATQRSTCAQISSGLVRLETLAADAGVTVQGAVRQVEDLTGVFFEAMDKAGKHSNEISQRVGDIVMAIQFHDNMRQRVAHIVEGLDAVQSLSKEGAPGDEKKEITSEKSAEVAPVLALQAAQLNQIISEIKDIYKIIIQAFDEILVHVEGFGSRLSALDAADVGGTIECEGDVPDPVEFLKKSLVSLDSLLGDGRGLIEEMEGAASHASHVAEKVSYHTKEVHGISLETHMMALNAIIKAAHLGEEGWVFEVLAQEVKRLSDRSTLFASDVEKNLTLLNVSARALQNEDTHGKGNLMGEGEAKALLDTGFVEITSGYARFTENALDVRERSGRLKKEISSVMSGLTFLPELADELTVQLKRMEAVMGEWQPFAVETENLTQRDIDNLVQRYTTSEELEIHEKMMGGVLSSVGGDMTDAETSTEDAVFFHEDPEEISHEAGRDEENLEKEHDGVSEGDVELFDALPDKSTEEAGDEDPGDNIELFLEAPPLQEDSSNDNIELFDDFSTIPDAKLQPENNQAEAGASDARKKDGEDDFGDNIELF